MSHDYIALLEVEPEGGYTVTFPEIGIAATYGANREEALAQAEDMLEEAVLGMMAHGDDVPAAAGAPYGGHARHRRPASIDRRQARSLSRDARRRPQQEAARRAARLAALAG